MRKEVQLSSEWKDKIGDFFLTDTFQQLAAFVHAEYKRTKVFPEPKDIFNAFNTTPFSNIRVVILGQDPYHNDGQAHGLSFSVQQGTPLPPSLKNIYKEIESDLGIQKDFTNGDLTPWASQGVFLLNALLTVEAHKPLSHQGKGWEVFTDSVIKKISEDGDAIVFMLWGKYARSKRQLIDAKKHLILEAQHPSPLSAFAGFLGSKHFSICNEYLRKHGKKPIDW
jgi:uracil-DNA glycosylase